MKFRRFVLLLLLLLVIAGGCSGRNDQPVQKLSSFTSAQQLNDPAYTIGVGMGTAGSFIIPKYMPKAKVIEFENASAYLAVQTGKIDAFAFDRRQMAIAIDNGLTGVKLLPETIGDPIRIAVGISRSTKIHGLKTKINEFISEMRASGILEDMYNRWIIKADYTMPDISVPTSSGLTLKVGTTGTTFPYTYYAGEKLTGYDIEFARRFASWLGAALEFKMYNYAGAVTAALAGDIDCVMANLNITAEREEKIDFSDPIFTEETALMVKDNSPAPAAKSYASISDLDGQSIGVITGTLHDQVVHEVLPSAKLFYFDSYANGVSALTAGKIDAVVDDEPIVLRIEHETPSTRHLDGYLKTFENGFIFTKSPEGDKLREEFNEFLRTIKSDGTLNRINVIWLGFDEKLQVLPDYENYPNINGVLRIAVDPEAAPFNYVKDNKLVGYDVDIVTRFCEARGYRPEINIINFDGVLPAVKSGKCDVGIGAITITPERAESVNFSEVVYTGGSAALVRKTAEDSIPEERPAQRKLSRLNGKRIGVQTGVDEWAKFVASILPDSQIVYYNTFADMAAALESRKIDAFICDSPVLDMMMAENSNITDLGEMLTESFDVAVAFGKNKKSEKLIAQWDEFITNIKARGELDAIINRWTQVNDTKKTLPDYASFPAHNGRLLMATEGDDPPFSYYVDNKLAGFEVELAIRFCEAYGYGLEIKAMAYDGILPAISSGKYDFALAALSPTGEHKESVWFSVPYYACSTRMAVLADNSSIPEAQTLSTLATYTKHTQLAGKKIGVMSGVDGAKIAKKLIPDAQIAYYNTYSDLVAALRSRKIDAFPCDTPVLELIIAQDNSIADSVEIFDESTNVAVALPKIQRSGKLKAQWDEFITNMKTQGKMDALIEKWTKPGESEKALPDYASLPATNGVMRMVTDYDDPPFSYYAGNKLTGLEVELAVRFCEAYGYGLEIQSMSYDIILSAIGSSKYDFALAVLPPTDENREVVLFSEPYYAFGTRLAVLAETQTSAPSMKYADVNDVVETRYAPAPKITEARAKYMTLDDLAGQKIGVQRGTTNPEIVEQYIPSAKREYFDTMTDILAALRLGDIEAFCTGSAIARFMVIENDDIAVLDKPLTTLDAAPIFPKTEAGEKLCEEFSTFIKAQRNNGTIQELDSIWFGKDESKRVVKDYTNLPAVKGTLKMAVDPSLVPFTYMKNNKIVGYDVDMAARFCESEGYRLEVVPMTFAAFIPALQSGKCDFAAGSIAITPERAEQVLFAYPDAVTGNALVVRKSDTATQIQQAQFQPKGKYTTLADLAGKKVGVKTGTTNPEILIEYVPTAKREYFNTTPDMLTALKLGKVEAICTGVPMARFMIIENDDVVMLNELLSDIDAAPIFPKTAKGKKLCDEFSAFAKASWEDGTIQELDSIWFGTDDSRRIVKDYSNLPATNGTLKMAVDLSVVPFTYVKDNKIVGYDIDFAERFCEANGYALEIVPMSLTAIIPALLSGRCDFAAGSIGITEERAEHVLFSYPNAKTGNAIVIRKSDAQPEAVRAEAPIRTRQTPPKGTYSSIAELAGKRLGVQTGALSSQFTPEMEAAPIFPKTEKGEKLCAQFSEFIKSLWADGTVQNMIDVWFGPDESKKTLRDYSQLPSTNGVIKVATDPSFPPNEYIRDNRIVGYDIDCLVRFCEAYGYGLELVSINFSGIIPAVMSGKCDLAISSFAITEERKESVLFSYPNFRSGHVFVVMKQTKAPAEEANEPHDQLSVLAGKKIGVLTGTSHPIIAAKLIPTAKLEYLESQADLFTALKTGRVDAISMNIPIARFVAITDDSFTMLGEKVADIECSPIFPKTEAGQKLCDQFSEFLKTAWNDGTMQEIDSIWFGSDESKRVVKDYTKLPAPNGVLRMACDLSIVPFTYMKDNKIVGYDVDCAVRFCEAYGYGLEIVPMNFGAMIPAIKSGRCDFAACNVIWTPERAEQVLFAYPNVKSGVAYYVRKPETKTQTREAHSSIDTLAGKKVGVQTGTTHPGITSQFIPTAKLEYFESQADIFTALKAGRVDAVCTNIPIARFVIAVDDSFEMIGGKVTDIECAPIFPKTEAGRKLCEQFSEFNKAAWENGTIQEVDSIWYGQDESKRVVKDYTKLPAPNGVLRMACDLSMVPFTYMKDNRIVGYDVDCVVRFCEAYGYGLEIVPMNFGAMIPALQSGKCDFAACVVTWTAERAEQVLYAYPNIKSGVAFYVRKQDAQPQPQEESSSISELAGKKIAVQTGSNHPAIAAKFVPTAKIEYFESQTDLFTALKLNKVAAVCTDIPVARSVMATDDSYMMFGDKLEEIECAPIFPKTGKGRRLCDQYSEFIKAAWKDGTIQEIDSVWFGSDESRKVVKDYTKLPAPNGVLRMAVDVSIVPFVYMKGNRIVGYDIDLAVRFCEKYGYGLEIVPMNVQSIIPTVQSGKCDFSDCSFAITEERKEQVLFSYPNIKSGVAFYVRKQDAQPQTQGTHSSFDELAHKKIAVQTGTNYPEIIAQFVPTAEVEYFDDMTDVFTALKAGKVDAVCTDIPVARFVMATDDSYVMLGSPVTVEDNAPIFPKTEAGRKLCDQFSEFLRRAWEDGTMQEIDSIWFGHDESKKVVKDYTKFPAPNGVLKMATDLSVVPFAYMKDNKIVGYDIDCAVRFCEAYGYGLEIVSMNFGAIIPSLVSGKFDFAINLFTITEERKEQVLFSYPNVRSGVAFYVRKPETQAHTSGLHADSGQYTSIKDFTGKKIGIILDTNHEIFAAEKIPDAKIEYFNDLSAVTLALQTGKIAAFTNTLPTAIYMTHEHKDMSYVPEALENTYTYSAFTDSDKGRRVCNEYAEFVKSLWNDGTIKRLTDKWIYSDNESLRTTEDYSKLPATNGVLRMAIDTGRMPFAYVKDNKITGYDIDIATMFCKAKGYRLEVYSMDFAGILGSIKTGKCDLTGSLTRTEERAETMLFSPVPNAETPIVLIVMKSTEAAQPAASSQTTSTAMKSIASFLDGLNNYVNGLKDYFETMYEDIKAFCEDLKASFNRTFIREERWRLFIEGIINTMIITVLSIICGTILGFVVYMLCRNGGVIANSISRFFIWLIQGMPMVVLLMILYYVIFGKVSIDGIWVAVIGFSLTFGSAVYGMLLSGVNAIDRGQTEAAYALGFTDRRAFFSLILPQAALHFMPAYKGEVVALIKATAIVGYIAVQDLTKMGDIVRSRTYEAFFPLIAVAVIYFVLAGLLNIIVTIIHNRIRPEKRTKQDILRGIDTHD